MAIGHVRRTPTSLMNMDAAAEAVPAREMKGNRASVDCQPWKYIDSETQWHR